MPKTIKKGGVLKDLSSKIARLRKDADISLNELARRSRLSVSYISKLESGEYENLKLTTSRSLADGFGMSLHDFLERMDLLEEKRPSAGMKLVMQALRSNKFTVKQAEDIIDYARARHQKHQDSNK